jgi:hypothetical protein
MLSVSLLALHGAYGASGWRRRPPDMESTDNVFTKQSRIADKEQSLSLGFVLGDKNF